MKRRPAATLDVSHLSPGAFGHRSVLWWGTLWFILIETVAFGLMIASYFFLRQRRSTWPPGVPPPDLRWGTLNVLVLLASTVPNGWAKTAAERIDLRAVRRWLVVCLVFGVAFNAIRVLEFSTLNVLWNTNAYGSAVWLLLGLHTVHIATDVVDTAVLTVLMFTGPIEEKRFVDVAENSFYWYFVVLAWIPVYAVIYLAPRLT